MAFRGLIVLLRDDEPPSIAYTLTDTFSEDCEPGWSVDQVARDHAHDDYDRIWPSG